MSTNFYTIELRTDKIKKGKWRATATCRGTGCVERTASAERWTKNAAALEAMKNVWQLVNFLGEQKELPHVG